MQAKAKVLFISMTAMSEPLGKSQVLEYLKALSSEYDISLHSFEKDLDDEFVRPMRETMISCGIDWTFQRYSNRFGVISTIWQIVSATLHLSLRVRKQKINIIHARGFIPVLMALLIKNWVSTKVLFDIRGFQVDEKAEVGRIKKGSLLYRLLKILEQRSYKKSDSIVSLTRAAKSLIEDIDPSSKVTVIPTCANDEVFFYRNREETRSEFGIADKEKVILHVGAVGNWYDFDLELVLINEMMTIDPDIRFYLLNKGEHDFIKNKLDQYQVDRNRVVLKEVGFYNIHKYLSMAEASIFLIKPSFSKTASMPTKFAENLCCRLFSITNNDIGDMNHYLQQFPEVGYSFSLAEAKLHPKEISAGILEKIKQRKTDSSQYQQLYKEHFSHAEAIKRYSGIYESLLE